MSGLQHFRKRQGGKRFMKPAILMLVLCATIFGCAYLITSILPGSRQDGWRIQISDNYYITKVHRRSRSISKASETPGLYQDVLCCFYVTKYCVSDPFIALEGIPTKELLASKKELTSDHRQYYLIDMRDDTLYGPYDTDSAMMDLEMIRTVDMSLAWEIVP